MIILLFMEKLILNKNNLSQNELAKLAKYDPSTMSLIVNKKRNPSWPGAKRLAAASGTHPEFWMEGTKADFKAFFKK